METNVMKLAWEIAKQGQKRFGGSVKQYFAQALKMAHKELKKRKAAIKFLDEYLEGAEEHGAKVVRINNDFAEVSNSNLSIKLKMTVEDQGPVGHAWVYFESIGKDNKQVVGEINYL